MLQHNAFFEPQPHNRPFSEGVLIDRTTLSMSDDVPAALELAQVISIGEDLVHGHSTSFGSAQSNPLVV